MKLTVKRFADNGDATLGILYVDGVFECFTVEDEERREKVSKETRVPNGEYQIKLRNEGGYNSRYSEKYGDKHKGMLCIHNKPNWILENECMTFQYILIHTGNTDDHTAGCLLVNDAVSGATFTGSSSRDAYLDLYPKIVEELEWGNQVTIEYIDIEEGR
jgi:hypothetical protein